MSDIERLSRAGSIIIDKADIISTNGTGLSVIDQIVQIDLYEDIFSPFVSGSIEIYESQDLLNFFPLIGEEVLNLEFHTPSVSKDFFSKYKFYIYKISEVANPGDRSLLYTLHFVSIESIVNINTKISKAFSGKVSDIAKKILTDKHGLNSSKSINVEYTKSSTKFVSNYWTPMKCIAYITGNAVNSNGSASYVFFENSKALNFVSLESLYSADVSHSFFQTNFIRDINANTGDSAKDPIKDFAKIKQLTIPVGFDYLDRCSGGMYGSRLITVDPVLKKYSSNTYTALGDFAKQKHLNANPVISRKAIARSDEALLYIPKHYGNFSGFTDVSNASTIQRRTSLLKQSEAFRINVTVFGRTDMTVGQKVYVEVPSKQPVARGDSKQLDNMSSGNFLIGAMHHKISRTKHEVDMELIKDSLLVDLNVGGHQ